MRTRVSTVLSLTVAAWLLVLAPAHAYVDPGTTGYVFSLIVAFFAAAGMTLKLFWRRIVGLFRPDAGDGDEAQAEPTTEATAERVTDEA